MAFRFTEDDFERYVTKKEHGGIHVWDDIRHRLEKVFAVPFTVNPWERRGDWLKLMWFFPRKTGRTEWRYQAMFYLRRSLDVPQLRFGLVIECPTLESVHEYSLDEDRDGIRLSDRLSDDLEFRRRLDHLVTDSHFRLSVERWDDGPTTYPQDSHSLYEVLTQIPADVGWSVGMGQTMAPDEAVAFGESVGEVIIATYQQLAEVWMNVIPAADKAFIEEQQVAADQAGLDRNSEAEAQRIIEGLLRDVASRRACLDLMADYITAAHRCSSATWEVTLFHDRARLNIGSIQTFVIRPGEVYLVLDGTRLTESDKAFLQEQGQSPGQDYHSVADTYDLQLLAENMASVAATVAQAYPTLVARAYRSAAVSPYRNAHSPGVVKYLRSFLDREIPDPDYGTPSPVAPASPSPLDLRATLQTVVTARGLHYTSWQLATFYTALQTKGFVILSGISGTGKTKLAQAFAEALPSARNFLIEVPDDVITITIKPYMLRYNRVIIPKHTTQLLNPPKAGESRDVLVKFADKQQSCRLTYSDYESTSYIALYFRGQLTPWFRETFKEGDTLGLRPELDDEGSVTGFCAYTEAELAAAAGTDSATHSNLLFVPVRPDWRDSKSLLGYYNPLIGNYQWTPFLRFILRAVKSYREKDGLTWFVILDEMNLAHVEYYFADLLSILESGRDAEGCTRESIRFDVPPDAQGDLPPKELRLPPNLYIVGTVNVDETTHTFSPKVLDRGFTLELTDVDLSSYMPTNMAAAEAALTSEMREALRQAFTRDGRFARIEKATVADYTSKHPGVREHLTQLNRLLQPYDLHFGYRVFDEIVNFLLQAEHNELYAGLGELDAALDAAVLMKVLPKFHGSRGKLEFPLLNVLAWCLDPVHPDISIVQAQIKDIESPNKIVAALEGLMARYPYTAAKARRMLWSLYTSGFAAFG